MPNDSSKNYCLFGFPLGFLLLLLVLSSFPKNESTPRQFFSSLTVSSRLDHTNALQYSPSSSSSYSPPISIKKNSNLGRREEELRKARVAIKKAFKFKNYTSSEDVSYIPTGEIYRNSFAFHRSHIEMMKTFKIWSYKEGNQPLFHDGPMHYVYGIEGLFMDELENVMGGPRAWFRASRPEEAHAFFLPFSVANIVQYVYEPITSPADYNRGRLHRIFNDYVDVLARKYSFWNQSNGADHFMVSCHDWAPDVQSSKPEFFKNFIRGLCNANKSEGFKPNIDFSIPEINMPRGKLNPPFKGQNPENRTILAFFAGRAHGYIRETLFNYWKGKDKDIQVYDSLTKGQDYHELIGHSKFCLCPSGYEVASPREAEAIYSGCVPVVISDNYSLPFSDVLDWSKFSVEIPVEKIYEIKKILQQIPHNEYLQMYKNVMKVRRHFVVNRPAQPFDVFHMILHSVWLRRLNIKLPS